uniref:Uncharacterized protein n=1 Tax=Periophthalmus magnuspinnatus TaxID=409849 RepID=A0A3B3ZJU8_9GOBI
MKVPFGYLVIAAGVCGVLSFTFLATALGTDYWYIIEMNQVNTSDLEDMSSHSGLWSINEEMHSAIVVLLPLSLVLLLLGGICGLVSSLARSPILLTGTASYFFICLLTLSGVILYIVYSYQALVETERLVGQEGLSYIRTSFGWSLALAWLSYSLELLTGVLLLLAARTPRLRHS